MNKETLIAKAETTIDAPPAKIWNALTDPALIKQYMFGSDVKSSWKAGGDIVWKGQWHGKEYEDHGKILEMVPNERLKYTHFSPLSGLEDQPSNYHTVTIDLKSTGDQTNVVLLQDNNDTEEQKHQFEKNWAMMLSSLKKLIEKGNGFQMNQMNEDLY